jgi:hypothetical protein
VLQAVDSAAKRGCPILRAGTGRETSASESFIDQLCQSFPYILLLLEGSSDTSAETLRHSLS